MLNYSIVRSDRKTASLHVGRSGLIEVRCPHNYPLNKIEAFIEANSERLMNLSSSRAEDYRRSLAFCPAKLDRLSLLGKDYPLRRLERKEYGFDGKAFCLPEGVDDDQGKELIVKIYKSLAKSFISQRVAELSALMNLKPKKVKINSAKSRWASCSSEGNLNFSWRLIMADKDCVDYVVIHELAHLRQANHSPLFWGEVERYCPDYKPMKQKLKSLQRKLAKENWD